MRGAIWTDFHAPPCSAVYPCRTMESATKLATRFVTGLLRHSAAKAKVTKSVR